MGPHLFFKNIGDAFELSCEVARKMQMHDTPSALCEYFEIASCLRIFDGREAVASAGNGDEIGRAHV